MDTNNFAKTGIGESDSISLAILQQENYLTKYGVDISGDTKTTHLKALTIAMNLLCSDDR